MLNKKELLEKIDEEIAYAKTTGMPQLVMGMNIVRDIIIENLKEDGSNA